ncbi:MAG TPA: inositol monophosphatase family protein [Candidatus Angelobacter sp.]|nr:inositol monophosphatase family protein [Candidatus Angelobacter sp.]
MTRQDYLTPIQELAREAGSVLMSYFGKVSVEYKGDVDLVTEADRSSEKLIVERIRKLWPSHDLMGEEGSRIETGSDFRWYIDPLDGTTNFAHGYPVFCISIALEHKGERIAGVLYDPCRNEMFAAEKGGGARLNERPIHVSKVMRLAESLVGTGFPSHKRHKNPNIHFYHQITLRSHGVRRAGSAALDLCCVACGRYDAFWEFNLNPWDTAAGVLLVHEAGGKVTNFTGGPFEISSREVLASNSLVHDELLAEFKNIFEGRVEGMPSPVEYFKAR